MTQDCHRLEPGGEQGLRRKRQGLEVARYRQRREQDLWTTQLHRLDQDVQLEEGLAKCAGRAQLRRYSLLPAACNF